MDPRKAKGPEAPKALLVLLLLFLPAVLPAQTPTPTHTFTFTYTFSVTPQTTVTSTSTATNTRTSTPTFSITITPAVTWTATPTSSRTPTPTRTWTVTSTPTRTWTATTTPTGTQTLVNTILDDFEDTDFVNNQGGFWFVDQGGSATTGFVDFVWGSIYPGSYSLDCQFYDVQPSIGNTLEIRTELFTTQDLRRLDNFYIAVNPDKAVSMRIMFKSSQIVDGDYYGLDFDVQPGWIYYAVPTLLMSQQGTGTPVPLETALSDCTEIVIRFTTDVGDLHLQIDDAHLVMKDSYLGTPTPTHTRTFTPTRSSTFTTTTCMAGGYTCTPTLTFTRTPTWFDSPTISPTPVATAVEYHPLDDFEDGDLLNYQGGAWITSVGGLASADPLTVVADTPYPGSHSLDCFFHNVDPSTGNTAELMTALVTTRDLRNLNCIVLAMYADRAVTVRFDLASSWTVDGDHYGIDAEVAAGWNYYVLPVFLLSQRGTGTPIPLATALSDCDGIVARVVSGTGDLRLRIEEIQIGFNMFPYVTPTASPTPGGGYVNSAASVAVAMGCSEGLVEEVRAFNLTPQAMYIVLRLCMRTGLSPAQIMALRANMGWDDICRFFGLSWLDLVDDVTHRISLNDLRHEPMTPNQIYRTGAYRIDSYPNEPAPQLPTAPLAPYVFQEACP